MMKEFALYLLKSGIWIAVIWSIYWIFLRKDTFYKFNRFFLLAGLIASFLIPLYSYRYLVTVDLRLMANDMPQVQQFTSPAWTPDLWFILLTVHLSGAVFLLVRRFIAIWKIKKMISRQGFTREADSKIVNLSTVTPTFSIFNFIFTNSDQNTSEIERKLIYEHEKAHIDQRHWIDLIVSHMACILQWFNPFVWLYLQAIKQNHEYLADQTVLQKGHSPAVYRAVLINYTFNAPVFAFANAFAQYNKFKRIDMMMKGISRPVKKLTIFLLIPAMAVFFWAFSKPEYVIKTTNPTRVVKTTNFAVTTIISGEDIPQTKVINVTLSDTTTANPDDKVVAVGYGIQKNDSEVIPDTATHKQSVINIRGLHGDGKPILYIVDGKECPDNLDKLDPQNIKNITVLKDEAASDIYGEKGRNGVIIVETKNK